MTSRIAKSLLLALLILCPASASAQGFNLRQALTTTGYKKPSNARRNPGAARVRANVIRTGIRAHRGLVSSGHKIKMPKSKVLKNKVAAKKTYGDSWTCRESSKALIGSLAGQGVNLTLSSSGQKTFDWGKEGKVSYHYYAVDNARKPGVLLDPTAVSNFAGQARAGGLLHSLLQTAGKRLGQPSAAERVARRIDRGGFNGMLVLANPAEITVYQAALELAADRARSGDSN